MIKKIEGIIISTVDYKENSKIINILSKEDGMIGLFAKGSKSPKSKLAATTNVLCYGTFHINCHGNSLPNVMEVDILNSFKKTRKDIIKLNYSLFLLELSGQVYRHDNSPKIYELLIAALNKINEGYDAQVITNILELKFLEYLGIKPVMDRCVNCQSQEDIVTISSYKGGYLCKNCVGNEFIYQIKTLKLLRMFYYVDLSKITKIEVNDTIKKEISLFIDEYYERYSGLYLKSKSYLEEFSKLNISCE